MTLHQLIQQFKSEGSAHIPGFFSQEECKDIINCFQKTVKPQEDMDFMRVKSFKPERHQYSKDGHVINPLLNVHDCECKVFSEKIRGFLQSSSLEELILESMGGEATLMQSMYFESNRGTEEHFDGDLFDTEEGGSLFGVWVALEEITEENGAFFYYPKSCYLYDKAHFNPAIGQKFSEYLALSSRKYENYKTADKGQMLEIYRKGKSLLQEIKDMGQLELKCPAYHAGDIVIFNSRILHGSFRPKSFAKTRNSISAHFAPSNSRIVRHGNTIEEIKTKKEGKLTYKTAC